MTDKQIITDENKINPNDWLEPYKPIPACEIKDCNELVYCGDGILGCRIAEDGLVCDDFNNDDECCMYRQLEYYKEALKLKEQECEELTSKCSQLEEEIKYWQKEVERIQFIGSYGIMDEVKKNTKLEQTLTEIKEIAITGLEGFCPKCSRKECEDNNCIETAIRDILQKISECEANQ